MRDQGDQSENLETESGDAKALLAAVQALTVTSKKAGRTGPIPWLLPGGLQQGQGQRTEQRQHLWQATPQGRCWQRQGREQGREQGQVQEGHRQVDWTGGQAGQTSRLTLSRMRLS